MNKINVFLVLLSISLYLPLNAQRYSKSQFTLISYTYEIDESISKAFEPYVNEISLKAESDEAKVNGMMVHTMWGLVSKKLQDSLMTYVLPSNSFNDKVKYDDYGYPDISIQKAIKLSDTKYYFRMHMILERELFDINGKKLEENILMPKVSLKIEIYDKNGYVPIAVADGFGKTLRSLELNKNYFAGMNFYNRSITAIPNSETLLGIFNRAATESVLELKYQKKK